MNEQVCVHQTRNIEDKIEQILTEIRNTVKAISWTLAILIICCRFFTVKYSTLIRTNSLDFKCQTLCVYNP